MAPSPLPDPTLTISKTEACRFLLAHHHLWPARQLKGKSGVIEFIQRVGSIQFDPINIVGRNPDLVLQARVGDYRSEMLDELLYADRKLLDGWDKMASIYPMEDWPNFLHHKNYLRNTNNHRRPPQGAIDDVLAEVHRRGPLSSLDFEETEKVDWYWGPTKIVRAALEHLYAEGHLGIDHRVNNRRSFDLIERLLPQELLSATVPFSTEKEYQDWHVLRRVGSLGLAHPGSGEYWLGIIGVKSSQRQASIKRLTQRGDLTALAIDEISNQTFFIRSNDLPTLEYIQNEPALPTGAALIAPLDNLIWNRSLISQLFDFDYIWEVYKPANQRQYGYYVLPVLYNDHFVARLDPAFDKKKRILTIQNWWWENDIQPDKKMRAVLFNCLQDFCTYLQTEQVQVGEAITDNTSLDWLRELEK
jgi:uncharacterized protein YcaQ